MTPITAPTQCPDCSSAIQAITEEKSGITMHWCENTECAGRIADMLTFIADRTLLEIEGLGPEMAAALAKGGYVVTLADLFEFSRDAKTALDRVGPDKFSEGMRRKGLPGAASIKMVETVERAKTASWDRWIAALGVPMIGRTLGKVLARELKLTPDGMRGLPVTLHPTEQQIEGVGHHKRAELTLNCTHPRFIDLCKRLSEVGVRPAAIEVAAVAEGAPLKGMSFCITGELYTIGSREYITQQLVKLGAVAKTGVSKKVTHLIVGSEPGASKLKKAAEQSVPTFDEDWLSATLTANGVKPTGSDMAMEWAD